MVGSGEILLPESERLFTDLEIDTDEEVRGIPKTSNDRKRRIKIAIETFMTYLAGESLVSKAWNDSPRVGY